MATPTAFAKRVATVAQDQHIYFDGMNIGQNLTGSGSQANGVTVNELAQT